MSRAHPNKRARSNSFSLDDDDVNDALHSESASRRSYDWISNAEKKHIIQILDGDFPDLIIIKSSIQHGQSTDYSSIHIEQTGTDVLHSTSYVLCDFCRCVFTKNGGHLKRHRESCKSQANTSAVDRIRTDTNSTKTDFDSAIVSYFTKSAKPLYSLETPEFRELLLTFANLGQRYSGNITDELILKRSSARNLLEKNLTEKTDDLYKMIKPFVNKNTAGILADFGKLNVDFLSIKASFLLIEKDNRGKDCWQLLIAPVAMEPANMYSKDADSVFEKIYQSLKKCDADVQAKNLLLVADGGSNIRLAGKRHFNGYIRCAAHATEIIGKRMITPYKKAKATNEEKRNLMKYSALMEECRKLTLELKSEKLKYKELGIPLVTPNTTRWMTSFTCTSQVYNNLSKLIAQMPSLSQHAEDIILQLSNTENRTLFEELSPLYKCIKECNEFFQKNTTTIAEVVPAYMGLIDEIVEQEAKTPLSKSHKTLLKFAKFAVTKQITDLTGAHFVSFYLHPCYKKVNELQDRLDDHCILIDAKDMTVSTLKKYDVMLNNDIVPTINTAPAPSSSTTESFISRRMKKSAQIPTTQTLEMEMKDYESDTSTNDPMYYWPEVKNRLPRLFNIAEKVFSCPASEADVERSFSQLKNIYSENRRSLDFDLIQKMMLVKQCDSLDK